MGAEAGVAAAAGEKKTATGDVGGAEKTAEADKKAANKAKFMEERKAYIITYRMSGNPLRAVLVTLIVI